MSTSFTVTVKFTCCGPCPEGVFGASGETRTAFEDIADVLEAAVDGS
jgi:hypothetical protein